MNLKEGVTPVQQGGLGEFLRQRRREMGISSQEDLAELAGVDQKKISNMEQDRNFRSPIPPPEVVTAVAKVLRVTEAELLRAAGYLTDSIAAKRLDDDSETWSGEQVRFALSKIQTLQQDLDATVAALSRQVMPDGESDGEVKQRSLGGI